jgi:hypothetical protein
MPVPMHNRLPVDNCCIHYRTISDAHSLYANQDPVLGEYVRILSSGHWDLIRIAWRDIPVDTGTILCTGTGTQSFIKE